MGDIQLPGKVKLFCGAIYRDGFDPVPVLQKAEKTWGKTDYASKAIPFTYTDYYNEEMGTPLRRIFWSFESLIDREKIVDIKRESNDLENMYATNGKRIVNLDPGYMTLGQLILATTKDREHRIYLGNGIFAEVTLWYSQKRFQSFPWSYRDYASDEYNTILLDIRKILQKQLKQ